MRDPIQRANGGKSPVQRPKSNVVPLAANRPRKTAAPGVAASMASKPDPESPSAPPEPGENEVAVRAECAALPKARERPSVVAQSSEASHSMTFNHALSVFPARGDIHGWRGGPVPAGDS
jgi:hypothetical protein